MTATADIDGLLEAAARLRTVPPDVAVYDTGAASVRTSLQIPAAQLGALARSGFPHRAGRDGEPLFDHTDLTNLALRSRLGTTVPELARRFLMRFAAGRSATWFDERTWRIAVSPPKGEQADWWVRPIDGAAPGITLHSATARPMSAVVTVAGRCDRVADPAVLALYEEILAALRGGEVAYQAVPERLRGQHARAWREGTADCVVVSRLLAARIAAAGGRARARRGYLLGLLGSDHAWAEVFEDGRWKCIDPVFELLASETPGTSEFQAACRGSRFNRLVPCATDDASPLVELAGRPAPPWALASVSCTPAARPPVDSREET